jgi:hypothetical protein
MQTITLDVQDNFVSQFMLLINDHKDKISVKKDKNLEQDPYFYERQSRLQRIRDEIKAGKTQPISDKEFWQDIDKFIDTLEQ